MAGLCLDLYLICIHCINLPPNTEMTISFLLPISMPCSALVFVQSLCVSWQHHYYSYMSVQHTDLTGTHSSSSSSPVYGGSQCTML